MRRNAAAKIRAGRRSAFVLCVVTVLPFLDKGWTRGPDRLQPFRSPPRYVTEWCEEVKPCYVTPFPLYRGSLANGVLALVLSNAERQARHRAKVRAMAEAGVTPDMIVEAARIMHLDDPEAVHEELRAWPDYLRWMNKKANRQHWAGNLPSFDASDAEAVAFVREQYGDDADLILKVSAIVRSVTIPPPAE